MGNIKDGEGFPITKAMLKPRERNGLKEIWFSTNTSSNKVTCFKENIFLSPTANTISNLQGDMLLSKS